LVKRYKTASSRIEFDVYTRYVGKLAEQGTVPNEDLKKHIEKVLENERTEKAGESPARNERPTGENREAKRTVTVNGTTYEL